MKRKHLFYSTSKLWEHHQYFTMKGWLRAKDIILNVKRYKSKILVRFGIKLQSKRRHRRSFAIRNLNRLYGCTLAELAWEERFCDEIGAEHGVTCEKPKKYRIYVYRY